MTILAFDVETQRLASEIEVEYTDELAGASAWERPDLFGFACGVTVNIESGKATHFGPGEAAKILEAVQDADVTVGYNSSQFDIGVLSAYGDLEAIRSRHIDLCAEVREGLEALPEAQAPEVDRLRTGGLNNLAWANGLSGKTGSGIQAVEFYRAGRIEELLAYCDTDTRLVADLYRLARGERRPAGRSISPRRRPQPHLPPAHHNSSRALTPREATSAATSPRPGLLLTSGVWALEGRVDDPQRRPPG